jgi:diguanylate cyclase (GGDEF)-like protein/PAS domain S-box-containing protein
MGIVQTIAMRARAATHLSATGLTLLLTIPLAGLLFYQQNTQNNETIHRAQRLAESYSKRIEHTLHQTETATTLLAEIISPKTGQASKISSGILSLINSSAILEITPDGQLPVIVTRTTDISSILSKQTTTQHITWQAPLPLGEPTIGIKGQQFVVSQSLANKSPEGRTRFWGTVSIGFQFPALAESIQLSELIAEGFGVRISLISNGMPAGITLFDSNPRQPSTGAQIDTKLRGNNQFRVEITPLAEIPYNTIASWVYLLICSAILFFINLRLLKLPNILEQKVKIRTKLLDDEKQSLKQEIQGRQEAELLLERSHRMLDSIFEHIPGMIILKRANDRRIARINRSGEQILSRSRQSLIGRSNDEIYSSELATRLNQSDNEVLRSHTFSDLPLEHIIMPGQKGRWVELRKTVLIGDDGKPEYILEFGQDVSEREKLDLRLREHLHFLEQLIDAIPGPLYFKDTKGRYIGVNNAFEEYIGVNRNDITKKTVFDIASPPQAYMHHQSDLDLLSHGGSQFYESTVKNHHGIKRDVILHKAVFHKTDGDIGGIVGIMLDITTRKNAEQQVNRLNRLLTLLSDTNQSIVRVRNPLQLLKTVADHLCRSGKFPIAWVHLKTDDQLLVSTDCAQKEALIRDLLIEKCHDTDITTIYFEAEKSVNQKLSARLKQEGMTAYVSLPLRCHGEHIGNIGILDSSLDSLGNNDKQLIEDLAHNISYALESIDAETARQKGAEQLELAARVFENSTEGIIITDARNRILLVNKTFAAVTGYKPEEVIGQNPNLLSSGRQPQSFYQEMWLGLQIDGEWQGEIENRRKNGEMYPEWLNISVVKQSDGKISNYVAIFSDLTKRKEIETRLNFLSDFDSLTSLPNRLQFQEKLLHSLEQAKTQKSKVALLMLDLDRFKIFNDTMGHAAGDCLLIEASNRLKNCISPENTLCRLGGDEFAIIVNDVETTGELANLAKICQQKLRVPIVLEGHEIHLSASIGISLFPDDSNDLEGLISCADSAMYAAVEQGGNLFRFFQQEMNARSSERLHLESRLHHALERGEFSVYFQPLVNAKTGQIIGAEALLRWHIDGQKEPVGPTTFIQLLEETKLIRPVGAWVIRKACEENIRWRKLTGEELFVAVNLSAIQLSDENLLEDIRSILHETQFDPRFLEIELTESAVMQDSEQGIRVMNQIRDLGIQLSIDDFGTGYSSLSYLKKLPFNTLKIDQSFVFDAATNENARAIIKAIVAMGHSLQFHIIAEGVENIEQLEFLRGISVDILQGYYFSRPLPALQFEELLMRRQPFLFMPETKQPKHECQPIQLALHR